MGVVHWIDDDDGYLNWLKNHPEGYVANIYKSSPVKQRTGYLKIHRADHKLSDRSNPNSLNPWTGNNYAKVTSDNLSDLLGWLKLSDFKIASEKYCMRCGLKPVVYPDEIPPEQQAFIEGATKQVVVNQYERNPNARSECIHHWGVRCYVCSFDFEKAYGPMGKGFIHVHHLTDIASIGTEYKIDPIKDLRPACPNCHAMLHTERPAIDIGVFKKRVARVAGALHHHPKA